VLETAIEITVTNSNSLLA